MRTFECQGRCYGVDAQGFLLKPSEWTEEFAMGMAPREGITDGLADQHWKVLYFIRNTFDKMKDCPLVYVACKRNDIGLGDLKRLFPTGYLRGACKLAGVTYREAYLQISWLEEHLEHNTRLYDQKTYQTDSQGFLEKAEDWDENFALQLAHRLSMPDYLTEKHWQIIRYLRDGYESSGAVPTIYQTCEDNGVTLEKLEHLFPHGYHRGAVKIAGLRVR